MYCTFVIQNCYNSWHGTSILFSDFLGDVDKITSNDLRKSAAAINKPDVTNIVYYVPKNVLTKQLEEINAVNITTEEHWNVAAMKIDKIRQLVAT